MSLWKSQKQITVYQPSAASGKIEKMQIIDGVVVDDETDHAGADDDFRDFVDYINSLFGSRSSGAKYRAKHRAKPKPPSDGNGRFYNPATDNYEYPPSNVSPFEVNYNPPKDYQGTACEWDGTS